MRTLIQHLRWNGPIHQKLQTIKTHQRWNRCPNHHLTIKEVDFINPSKEKSPDPDDFISEFRQTFQELTPTLNNLFQKIEKRMFPNSCYDTSIILMSIPDKDIIRKENYSSKSIMNIDEKKPFWNISTSKQYIKRIIHLRGVYPRNARLVQYLKINQCNPY